jgi:hypothetical protein
MTTATPFGHINPFIPGKFLRFPNAIFPQIIARRPLEARSYAIPKIPAALNADTSEIPAFSHLLDDGHRNSRPRGGLPPA